MTSSGGTSREIRCGRVGCSLNSTLDDVHDGASNSRLRALVAFIEFGSRARMPTVVSLASIACDSSVPAPSFLVFRSPARPTIRRPLFAYACTQAGTREKNNRAFSADGPGGRIPRARITPRRCLSSISSRRAIFSTQKIVLRARFGSITVRGKEQEEIMNMCRSSSNVVEEIIARRRGRGAALRFCNRSSIRIVESIQLSEEKRKQTSK